MPVNKRSHDFSCVSDHSGKDIYTNVDFRSNIKNFLAMGLAHDKKQPHNAKSFMKLYSPV